MKKREVHTRGAMQTANIHQRQQSGYCVHSESVLFFVVLRCAILVPKNVRLTQQQ